MKNTIKLTIDCITQIPIDSYSKDFMFIVNGEKYQTSKVIADLLSSKISNFHKLDFTFSEYTINTTSKGSFQNILQLVYFEQNDFPDTELPFIREVIEDLGIDKIDTNIFNVEITMNNVTELIKKHENLSLSFSHEFTNEIDFLSENFYKLKEEQINELLELRFDTIERIINNEKLTLFNEDQLLDFIHSLCSVNSDFYSLYEYVYFNNISKDKLDNFISDFDFEYLSYGIWKSLSNRFLSSLPTPQVRRTYTSLSKSGTIIEYDSKDLKGLFNYLRTHSKLNDEVKVSYSSYGGHDPNNLLDINMLSKGFYTNNKVNSFICFEFKKHKIIPSSYTIRSQHGKPNFSHLRSWVIEASIDNVNWLVLDKQSDCNFLNGSYNVHNFPIKDKVSCKDEGFNFIRIKQTGRAWDSSFYLHICSFEFYGIIV